MQLHDYLGQVSLVGTLNSQVVYFEDFVSGGKTTATNWGYFGDTADVGEWFVTASTTSVGYLPKIADTADGGWVDMKTDATTDEHLSMQLNGEAFTCVVGRELYFQTRVKFLNTSSDWFLGLAISTTSPHTTRPAGFIAFTGTADADIEYATGNTATATASADTLADFVANTFVTLAFRWDGVSKVHFYVDGVLKISTTTTPPLGIALSPIFEIQANASTAGQMTVDYVLVVMDRA